MTEITASLEYLFCYRFNVRNDLKKVFICHLPTAPSNHTSNYTIAFKEKKKIWCKKPYKYRPHKRLKRKRFRQKFCTFNAVTLKEVTPLTKNLPIYVQCLKCRLPSPHPRLPRCTSQYTQNITQNY